MHKDIETRGYIFEDLGTSLQYTISCRKHWLEIILISIYLLSLLFYAAVILINAQSFLGNISVMIAILVFAGVVSILSALELLWQFKGKEVVEIESEQIVIRHKLFEIETSRWYSAEIIDGVFISHFKDNLFTRLTTDRNIRFLSFVYGKIAINHGKTFWGSIKTARFGTGLTHEEAKEVVKQIHERFPYYRPFNFERRYKEIQDEIQKEKSKLV